VQVMVALARAKDRRLAARFVSQRFAAGRHRRCARRRADRWRVGWLAILLLLLGAPGAQAAPLIGIATVVDADTIEIYGMHIRLAEIDGLEDRQTCWLAGRPWHCGETAIESLAAYLAGRLVSCSGDDFDPLGRLVAVCYVASRNLNSWLVAEGWALPERDVPTYIPEALSARDGRRGMWASHFVAPWKWRATNWGDGWQ